MNILSIHIGHAAFLDNRACRIYEQKAVPVAWAHHQVSIEEQQRSTGLDVDGAGVLEGEAGWVL